MVILEPMRTLTDDRMEHGSVENVAELQIEPDGFDIREGGHMRVHNNFERRLKNIVLTRLRYECDKRA